MRIGVVQFTSSDVPHDNLTNLLPLLTECCDQGAEILFTPEVTNCVSTSRHHQMAVLTAEDEDETLRELATFARDRSVWLAIGSLALKTRDPDGRFANRSFLIDPAGKIVARYDKIHMFDVTVSETEVYQESKGYRPGETAVVAQLEEASLGLTICYDVRFPHLYRDLAKAGADIIAVPSAFSPVTGDAHWHALLRARAIETGAFIVAAAQTGTHPASTTGAPRKTHGHSLVVAPWGEVLLDAGHDVGAAVIDLDLAEVAKARQRVPSLSHDRAYTQS